MVNEVTFQTLSEEWSALVDLFLETEEGSKALSGLGSFEQPIVMAMLKAYANLLATSDKEVGMHFADVRKRVYQDSLLALEQTHQVLDKQRAEAKKRCNELRMLALNASGSMMYVLPKLKLQASGARGRSKGAGEVLLSDAILRTLELASHESFKAPPMLEGLDSDPPAQQADEPEIPVYQQVQDEGGNERITMVVGANPTVPVEYDADDLKGLARNDLARNNLEEVCQAFCEDREIAIHSEPPPIHVSRYPASPPPPLNPDEPHEDEACLPTTDYEATSDLPAPSASNDLCAPEDPVEPIEGGLARSSDATFAEETPEIVTAEILDESERVDLELDSAFSEANLGPDARSSTNGQR